VVSGRRLGERGLGRTGCLFWILVLVAAGYFGADVGAIYVRKWRIEDEVKTQAAFAANLTDETIRRRLLDRVEQLDLPPQARNIFIRRTVRPTEIRIRLSYPEVVELPFLVRDIEFTIDVSQRL